jgi:D-alanyl-D-alanine carboxypeptidase
VDAETTLFRIASVTKLFPWTAVMQLVEQGKLNLKADAPASSAVKNKAVLNHEYQGLHQ